MIFLAVRREVSYSSRTVAWHDARREWIKCWCLSNSTGVHSVPYAPAGPGTAPPIRRIRPVAVHCVMMCHRNSPFVELLVDAAASLFLRRERRISKFLATHAVRLTTSLIILTLMSTPVASKIVPFRHHLC